MTQLRDFAHAFPVLTMFFIGVFVLIVLGLVFDWIPQAVSLLLRRLWRTAGTGPRVVRAFDLFCRAWIVATGLAGLTVVVLWTDEKPLGLWAVGVIAAWRLWHTFKENRPFAMGEGVRPPRPMASAGRSAAPPPKSAGARKAPPPQEGTFEWARWVLDDPVSLADARRIYRRRIKRVHPDVAGPAGAEESKRLNAAWEILKRGAGHARQHQT